MISLNKLEIFATVARVGSFSAAAEQLLMTQPAVSQHIHDLEASLGTRLFERGRRGVTLTPAGSTLSQYADAIFKLVAEAENAVTNVEQLAAGQLSVGATPGVSGYLLPEAIQEFHARFPKLNVLVQTDTTPHIVAGLQAGSLQLGLVEGELNGYDASSGKLVVHELQVVDQLVVVGSRHPWWGRSEVSLTELTGQTLVTRQRTSQSRIWLDGILQQHALYPRIGAEFDNMESIKRTVANGVSVAILPGYAIDPEVESGRLWALCVAGEPLQRTLKLVWSADHAPGPVAQAFLPCLRRYLAGEPTAGATSASLRLSGVNE
jgi:LysR family transcriptional regulator, low CO2-responsive transcriptional regulator